MSREFGHGLNSNTAMNKLKGQALKQRSAAVIYHRAITRRGYRHYSTQFYRTIINNKLIDIKRTSL